MVALPSSCPDFFSNDYPQDDLFFYYKKLAKHLQILFYFECSNFEKFHVNMGFHNPVWLRSSMVFIAINLSWVNHRITSQLFRKIIYIQIRDWNSINRNYFFRFNEDYIRFQTSGFIKIQNVFRKRKFVFGKYYKQIWTSWGIEPLRDLGQKN